jgi:bifunctional non-homologous end joining protein LigD
VKSGKTLADVAGDPRARTWQSKPSARSSSQRRRASAKRDPVPHPKSLMLATLVERPFDDPNWLFEIKWDGYRALCTVDEKGVSLISRNGLDMLRRFPALEALAGAFGSRPVVVDGEIVSLDSNGRSAFQRLQESQKKPAGLTYAAFDLLYADGTDLRSTPLQERKALLERLIRDDTLVLYSKHVIGKGKALYENARKQNLEGIIGKKRDSIYQERRSRDWVKIKTMNEQEFIVGGWTEPKGSRKGFGALLLGVREGKALRFVGSVGTGFSSKLLKQLYDKLRSKERRTSPFANDVVANAPVHWTSPELVVEVRFSEWTRDRYLRQPAYVGMRPDKSASDVVAEIPVDR